MRGKGEMMKTVYAVNSGSYSDYSVDAMFSTKKLAEEFMKVVKNNDYNEIQEFQLDPPTVDLIKRGYSVWRVLMLIDGSTERVDRTENELYDVGSPPSHHIWKRTEAPAYKGKSIPDALDSRVWAKTEKHAIKIVNEKRVQMIAMNEW